MNFGDSQKYSCPGCEKSLDNGREKGKYQRNSTIFSKKKIQEEKKKEDKGQFLGG